MFKRKTGERALSRAQESAIRAIVRSEIEASLAKRDEEFNALMAEGDRIMRSLPGGTLWRSLHEAGDPPPLSNAAV